MFNKNGAIKLFHSYNDIFLKFLSHYLWQGWQVNYIISLILQLLIPGVKSRADGSTLWRICDFV